MYLAAIADSQPQAQTAHAQIPPNAVMQSGGHYMQHQQAQQQVTPQSLMAARSSILYAQQQQQQQHQQQQQQQQSLHSQLGINSGGSSGLHMLHSETNMGCNGPLSSGGFPEFGRGSATSADGMQVNRGFAIDRGSNKQDGVGSENAHAGAGDGRGSSTGGQNADESEPSYLKASEEEGN